MGSSGNRGGRRRANRTLSYPRPPAGPGRRARAGSRARPVKRRARRSVRLQPRLSAVEGTEVAADLERPGLDPQLCPVDLAVLGIHDRAPPVALAGGGEALDDDEADDGRVLVGPGAGYVDGDLG